MKAPQYKKVIVFVGFSLFILSSFSLMRNLKKNLFRCKLSSQEALVSPLGLALLLW